MSVEVIVPPPAANQYKINWTLSEPAFLLLTKTLGRLTATNLLYTEYVELANVRDTLDSNGP